MTEREALKLALEALEESHPEAYRHTITAIKEALAQPEQEPVAWLHWLHGPVRLFLNREEATMELDRLNREYPVDKDARQMKPLYTTPPQRTWVGLTDEEVKQQWEVWRANAPRYVGFAKGIEAKLKEKNT